jgi:hypothetical protein
MAGVTGERDLPRSTVLTGVVIYGLVLIVLFTAAFAYRYFLLLNTGEPVLVWLGMVVATAFGLAPMISLQPAVLGETKDVDITESDLVHGRIVSTADVRSLPGALPGRQPPPRARASRG